MKTIHMRHKDYEKNKLDSAELCDKINPKAPAGILYSAGTDALWISFKNPYNGLGGNTAINVPYNQDWVRFDHELSRAFKMMHNLARFHLKRTQEQGASDE